MPNSYVKIRLYVQIKPKCFIYCYCWWLPKKLYSLESLYNFLSVFKQTKGKARKQATSPRTITHKLDAFWGNSDP